MEVPALPSGVERYDSVLLLATHSRHDLFACSIASRHIASHIAHSVASRSIAGRSISTSATFLVH